VEYFGALHVDHCFTLVLTHNMGFTGEEKDKEAKQRKSKSGGNSGKKVGGSFLKPSSKDTPRRTDP
jgi:hypothetical protein